jgi:hypothetical protein
MKLRSGKTIGVAKSLVRNGYHNLSVEEMLRILRIRDLYLRVGFVDECNHFTKICGLDQSIHQQKEIGSE